MKTNKGWFRKGHDPRRACFTSEQARAAGSKPTCHRLTAEHRRKGGQKAWLRIMAELRLDMHLDLPLPALREMARKILDERAKRKKATPTDEEIPY